MHHRQRFCDSWSRSEKKSNANFLYWWCDKVKCAYCVSFVRIVVHRKLEWEHVLRVKKFPWKSIRMNSKHRFNNRERANDGDDVSIQHTQVTIGSHTITSNRIGLRLCVFTVCMRCQHNNNDNECSELDMSSILRATLLSIHHLLLATMFSCAHFVEIGRECKGKRHTISICRVLNSHLHREHVNVRRRRRW